jgi:hypothetical protein
LLQQLITAHHQLTTTDIYSPVTTASLDSPQFTTARLDSPWLTTDPFHFPASHHLLTTAATVLLNVKMWAPKTHLFLF